MLTMINLSIPLLAVESEGWEQAPAKSSSDAFCVLNSYYQKSHLVYVLTYM